MSVFESPHRRYNPLLDEWVLVSPHRNNRPWQGAVEAVAGEELPVYESDCPLCPGNERANGELNADYQHTFVFTNDFGAIKPGPVPSTVEFSHPLARFEPVDGVCRVVCFSPDHSKTLADMAIDDITRVVYTWRQHYLELSNHYPCIHIFENKGAAMGCSQPHPHGQIWAHQHRSSEIEKENACQAAYFSEEASCLLDDYLQMELADGSRTVAENNHWIVVVPYWAKWPFETLLLTKSGLTDMGQLDEQQVEALAAILSELTIRYDNLFRCRFPYSMGWHNAPGDMEDKSHWRLHAHFYPPLLRSATVKKFMVGYEMLAESQRDLTPERAAHLLREVSGVHYSKEAQR
ncbi:UDP-glucose--hexose-1-phosphate uridylyltransferase [Shewanella submarina]|uniref:Galactose-1-phosphate uridylyltransferase n=1 Tax=Shewanella submarina TaxID=2016376 RepID=A0ABV7G7V0_9GAMM|nr:UDP-glucose--hexose-1-phosphate uridylyltransferase [Shewanella submarina]MCL1037224.1 UDP-glucose--hexose-1-phosphate uridylyltransferase [Shewanella submarina]